MFIRQLQQLLKNCPGKTWLVLAACCEGHSTKAVSVLLAGTTVLAPRDDISMADQNALVTLWSGH